jgi:hypothetical protein
MAAVAAELVPELHAQQLGHALVELVVADAGDVEMKGVHRLDRGLVVEQPRDERACADEVAGADGDRVRIRGAKALDPGREILDPACIDSLSRPDGDPPGRPRRRLEIAVEVVDRK